ncbi:lysylphosphatidylglycerol synthase transmembrane domain-containing protein [Teredinibacter turnerae]|uniref:lysylphosphatidylglycerol synthase transmembrane domain-containing protein n=1 Tax=Teredinibacter turnerae TaxID=2426 RepID=UPI0004082124|nr:lysylphosphatidylglycerol synthase transmembrane domain-containing protein [Teredinibacter turnerae]
MPYLNKIITVTLISILAYAAWVVFSGYDEVSAGLQRVSVQGFAVLVLLSLFNYGVRFLRWHWMIARVTGVSVPLKAHMECYVSGFALTATPGKVGEALRSVYLKEYGVKASDSLAALFAERLIDLISVLIIGSFALFYFEQFQWAAYLVIAVVVVSGLCLRSRLFLQVLESLATNARHPTVKKVLSGLSRTLQAAAKFMGWRIWLVGLVMGVVSWGAEAWGFVLLVKWLTGNEWILLAAGIYSLSMIVGALSFMPGGLGGAEAVMASMLVMLGVSFSDATVATIICRVVTLWLAIFIGLAVMAKLQMRYKATFRVEE